MELIKSRSLQYVTVSRAVTAHEESLDAIVPDTFPDIETICCTMGSMEVREKLVQTDRVMISGNIRGTLVYRGENGGQLCALECTIPFAALVEARGCKQQDVVYAKATLQRIEGRMLNPRKFAVRAEFGLDTEVCTTQECEICEGIAAAEQDCMQTLIEEYSFETTVCMREKSFSIHEDVRLSGEDCSAEDKVLRTTADFTTEDVRVISNKVMLRGSVRGEAVLLRGATGLIVKESFTLPYSQIIELDSADDGDGAQVDYSLKNCVCTIVGGDGGAVLQCDIAADVCVRIQREIRKPVLMDAFSTACECTLKQCPLEMPMARQKITVASDVRCVIETPERAEALCDASITVKNCGAYGAEGTAHAGLCVSFVYSTGEGQLLQYTQMVECEGRFAKVGPTECQCSCDPAGLALTCIDGAMQLAGTVNFTIAVPTGSRVMQVASCELVEGSVKPCRTKASLILRCADGGESVWQLAKDFNTSPQAIMAANKLEDSGPLQPGHLVMIPFQH